jgi:hypothetical protein
MPLCLLDLPAAIERCRVKSQEGAERLRFVGSLDIAEPGGPKPGSGPKSDELP